MLKDLQTIPHEVVDRRTRPLVAEAIAAYEAGALRSATVSLWIAVVADLTFKIRHLSDSGDGAARVAIEKLDKAIAASDVRGVQEYERGILKLVGTELGILSAREVVELERLNEDRNLCAHPGFISDEDLFVPEAEAVRSHLVATTRAAFSQPPLAGKRLLDIFDSEITGSAWPDGDVGELKQYLLDRFFRNTRSAVQNNLMRLLVKGSIRPREQNNVYARRFREATYVVADTFPAIFEQILRSVLGSWEGAGALADEDLIRSMGAFGAQSVYWEAIPDTARKRLTALLERSETEFLITHRLFVSGTPTDEDAGRLFQEIVSDLNRVDLEKAIRMSRSKGTYVVAALALVRSSGTFREAEANLRILERLSGKLDASHIQKLADAILENEYSQVRLAGDTESILIGIYSDGDWSKEHEAEWKSLALRLKAASEQHSDRYRYEQLCEVVGADV